jgi:peptidoglycan/LPS O-acetylase OafA/YrhL
MRFTTMSRTTKRIVVLLFVLLAITAAVIWTGSFKLASAQPPCDHDWCNWYEVCKWEYWAWDADEGWELLHTDGYC